ncbi:CPBP family intramembrane metalloprotease [Brevibacterium sp. S22]|nr:CPBP family intramembrane metalloprotease [Brevibacterium sp. S22]
MVFASQLVVVVVASAVSGMIMQFAEANSWLQLIVGVACSVATVVAFRRVVRRSEKRNVAELSGHDFASRISLGVLIGLAMAGFVFGSMALLGSYRVQGLGSPSNAVGLAGFMIAVGVTEELLYRGVIFRVVERVAGTWISLVGTGAMFGGLHLFNPRADLWGAFAIMVEAGVMLAAAYVATRSLWTVIGIHVAWNYAIGGIFGTEVSGSGTPTGLLDASTSGNPWVTGGDFGPEGSLYTVAAGLTLTLVFCLIAHRKGNIVRAPWRAKRTPVISTLDL